MRTWLTLLGLRPARKVRLSSVLMKAVAPVSAIKSFPPSCSKMVLGTVKSVILAILLVSLLLAGCDAGTRGVAARAVSLSRFDPLRGFVRSCQRFVRLSQASVGLDQWALQRSQEGR